MPAPTEPLAADRAAALRDTVLALKAEERCRTFAPTLRVGVLGGRAIHHGVRADETLDQALRTEVVGALLLRARALTDAPILWLARPGEPTWHDEDAAWLPAADAAYAEAGVPLMFMVVTRHGWYDPRSGVSRRWRRLRDRRPLR